jgi:hypothetical protein
MVIAMDTGYFGLKAGHGLVNGVFIGSLIPHVSYGIALGLLLARYVRHEGTVFGILRDLFTHTGAAEVGAPARSGRG